MLTRRQLGTGAAALLAAGSARAGTLEADAVSNHSPARSVLWSWTTGEQLAELRGGSPLFTRVTDQDGERGYLYSVLAQKTGPAVELLRGRRFDKGRFGWWNPWATCDGFLGERWGERLIRIELVPHAWLAVVRSSRPQATVFDLDNRPVSEDQLRAHPERLAGAFFVHDQLLGTERWACNPSIGGWVQGYREVYLGDESLVRGWTADSVQLRDRLASAAGCLEALAAIAPEREVAHCRWAAKVLGEWDAPAPPADALEAYRRALAFSTAEYDSSPGNLRRLATLLRSRFL